MVLIILPSKRMATLPVKPLTPSQVSLRDLMIEQLKTLLWESKIILRKGRMKEKNPPQTNHGPTYREPIYQ